MPGESGQTATIAVNENKCTRQTLKSLPRLILGFFTKLMKETVETFFASDCSYFFSLTEWQRTFPFSLCVDLEDANGALPSLP